MIKVIFTDENDVMNETCAIYVWMINSVLSFLFSSSPEPEFLKAYIYM